MIEEFNNVDHVTAHVKTNLLKNNKIIPVVSQINQTIA
jgi:hypothetical protein